MTSRNPRNTVSFRLRRWYWNQPPQIRMFIQQLPNWLLAIAIGLALGCLAAERF